jgi:hypothetical protein
MNIEPTPDEDPSQGPGRPAGGTADPADATGVPASPETVAAEAQAATDCASATSGEASTPTPRSPDSDEDKQPPGWRKLAIEAGFMLAVAAVAFVIGPQSSTSAQGQQAPASP